MILLARMATRHFAPILRAPLDPGSASPPSRDRSTLELEDFELAINTIIGAQIAVPIKIPRQHSTSRRFSKSFLTCESTVGETFPEQ
jgi:hypothetical protein